MKMIYKNPLVIAALVSIIFLLTISALASLEVSGSFLEAEVSPGDSLSHEITVTLSDSNSSANISVDLLGYGQGIDGAVIGLQEEDDSSPYSARPYLNVSPARFELQPDIPQKVILDVKIPQEADSGGRYALAFIHTDPVGESNVKIITGINVPVMLNIKDSEKLTTGAIESLTADEPISAKMVNTSLIFKNTGNTLYNILVEGWLEDKEGNILAETSKSTFIPILPTFSREVRLRFSPAQELDPGTYVIEEVVKLEDNTTIATEKIELDI